MRIYSKSILLCSLLALPAAVWAQDITSQTVTPQDAPSCAQCSCCDIHRCAQPQAEATQNSQAASANQAAGSTDTEAELLKPNNLSQMKDEDERAQIVEVSAPDGLHAQQVLQEINQSMQTPQAPSDDPQPPASINQPEPVDPAPIPAPAEPQGPQVQQQPADGSTKEPATNTLACACPALSTLPAPAPLPAEKNWPVEFAGGIAAIVNNHVITADELKREMAPIISQIRRECRTQSEFNKRVEALSHQVLQNLVDHMLVVDYAESKGIKVPASYVDNDFEDFLNKQFNGDRARYQEFLKFQGKTDRQFHREIEERIIVAYMRGQQRKSQAEVSPEKIAQFYDQHKQEFYQDESVHLRQIMLLPTNAAKCSEIYLKLQQGGSFEELAKQYSQDDRRSLGGDWGWVDRRDIRSELADVAFNIQPKTYSAQPVNLQGTLFILYVEDKHQAGILPLEQVRSQIENQLASELAQEAQARWLETLRKGAYIKYYI